MKPVGNIFFLFCGAHLYSMYQNPNHNWHQNCRPKLIFVCISGCKSIFSVQMNDLVVFFWLVRRAPDVLSQLAWVSPSFFGFQIYSSIKLSFFQPWTMVMFRQHLTFVKPSELRSRLRLLVPTASRCLTAETRLFLSDGFWESTSTYMVSIFFTSHTNLKFPLQPFSPTRPQEMCKRLGRAFFSP